MTRNATELTRMRETGVSYILPHNCWMTSRPEINREMAIEPDSITSTGKAREKKARARALLSNELAALLSEKTGATMPRSEVFVRVSKIVKERGLIDPKGKRIQPDAALARVVGIKPVTNAQLRSKVRLHTKPI